MKQAINIMAALAVMLGMVAQAAQDTDITQAEARDPRRLETYLEANASDAQTRLASLEAVSLTNTTLSSVTLVSNATAKVYASNIVVKTGGTLTIPAGALANDTVREADLMAVDSASDEDFLSYESTTGDFEWHSAAEIAGKFTEGVLADSIIVTADIKDGDISEADLKAVDTAADEDVMTYESTTGDFEWHSVAEIMGKATEGSLADSTVVSADIKDGEITAADLAADSVAASELASDSVTKDCLNAEDFGDFTAGADGTVSIDSGAVLASELGDGTLPAGVVSAEFTIDGKYAAVGPNATAGLMLQTTNVTMHTGTVWTQTWQVVFGAAPVVTATYTEDPGDVRPIFVGSVTPSNCLVTVAADKNFALLAVGVRP